MIYVSHLRKYPGDNRYWYHVTSDVSLGELSDFLTRVGGKRVHFGATNTSGPHLALNDYTRYDVPYEGNGVERYHRSIELVGGPSNISLIRRAGRVLAHTQAGRGKEALEEMAKLPRDS